MKYEELVHLPDINRLGKEAMDDPSILLMDVRTDEEYRGGHIPGSLHLELSESESIPNVVKDKEQKLYVYCRSGVRSEKACSIYRSMGYQNVTNIGGISYWNGELSIGD